MARSSTSACTGSLRLTDSGVVSDTAVVMVTLGDSRHTISDHGRHGAAGIRLWMALLDVRRPNK